MSHWANDAVLLEADRAVLPVVAITLQESLEHRAVLRAVPRALARAMKTRPNLLKDYAEVAALALLADVRNKIVDGTTEAGWAGIDALLAGVHQVLPHPAFAALEALVAETPRASTAGLTLEVIISDVCRVATVELLRATNGLTARAPSLTLPLTTDLPFVSTDDDDAAAA